MAKYSKRIENKIVDLIREDSYTIAEICEIVGISERTYYNWQSYYAEFAEAIKKAKNHFDEKCVKDAKKSLMKLVNGYEVEEKKTVYVSNLDGKPKIKEQTVTIKHIQPSLGASIFLLTNKAPDEWKNKQNTDVTTQGEKISNECTEVIFKYYDGKNTGEGK